MTFVPPNLYNIHGVFPPYRQSPASRNDRSPYKVSLSAFVKEFGYTESRRNLFEGFLKFRKALHDIGLIQGFQWLDGSFLEDKETLKNSPPNDIDVVTFFEMPAFQTQKKVCSKGPDLFNKLKLKTNFLVDGYYVALETYPIADLIDQTTYWYSLWSHRRDDDLWKGFVEVDLSPYEDEAAFDELMLLKTRAGGAS